MVKRSREEWEAHWLATRRPLADLAPYREQLLAIISQVSSAESSADIDFQQIVRQHPYDGKRTFSKNQLVMAYRQFCEEGLFPLERRVLRRLQMKPTRTISGVAPVTVLTKQAPCPGECIFCPQVEGQPKSYLPDEPGAARAASFDFDPYEQTSGRVTTFQELGHTTDKVELLILGGSWHAYPSSYREWFVKRCFEALNGRQACSLSEAHLENEHAQRRNVGLVIETRPDMIDPAAIADMRRLGVTKVQLGIQSLDDRILALNRRGHSLQDTRRAMHLLRLSGFKIVVHWMPNLYGADLESDRTDFAGLWQDPSLRPDELKIYPTALLKGTALHQLWQAGHYQPYAEPDLIDLVADCKAMVPSYCRINRVMRDIPAGNIVAGTTKSNLRQLVQNRMAQRGIQCACIRCSEIRGRRVTADELMPQTVTYETDATTEHMLRFSTVDGKLGGFLRLSLPHVEVEPVLAELAGRAMIREVHIYGPALEIDAAGQGEAQHIGLGRQLIQTAIEMAAQAGLGHLAVIAAVGTRQYYRKHGFELTPTGLYMERPI